jgi:hypothetical protein
MTNVDDDLSGIEHLAATLIYAPGTSDEDEQRRAKLRVIFERTLRALHDPSPELDAWLLEVGREDF